ncbi:hypothetical protein GCM10009793_24830 [Brachybacterium phenoliresistens]|uniref:Uncharacterized protein n=1 Tax=Brachybacterium phenoliresistens TaxID=396014 RepID=Z9JXF7_9MICO|nr:hypothetical protein BF93_12245 [Brachybacterium phenoliresistens]
MGQPIRSPIRSAWRIDLTIEACKAPPFEVEMPSVVSCSAMGCTDAHPVYSRWIRSSNQSE